VGYDKLALHEQVLFVNGITDIQKEKRKSQEELV
jgi:hypothetical protein